MDHGQELKRDKGSLLGEINTDNRKEKLRSAFDCARYNKAPIFIEALSFKYGTGRRT